MAVEPQGPHDVETIPTDGRRSTSELLLRLASGVGLAIVALGLLWLGVLYFGGLVLLIALVAGWEWGRIVRGDAFDVAHVVHGLATAGATILAALGYAALGIAVITMGAIIVLALEFGQRPILSALGVAYTGLPAISLLWLRGNEPFGVYATLLLVGAAAVTDTAAFASGRVIGGPRLAPRVSPNKTWSGFIGGVACAAMTAAAFAFFMGLDPMRLALLGLVFGLIAQAGDLAESALKRAFDVKDASNLIPGHGGFLDRVDGVIAAATLAGFMALISNPQAPAQALLFGH